MSIGTLWTTPIQPAGKIIRAVAALNDIVFDIPESKEPFVDIKKPEFLAEFPLGKIPAWKGKDGVKIFECLPIARYLAKLAPNNTLLGTSLAEEAHVDQWAHMAETEMSINSMLIHKMCTGMLPYNKATHTALSVIQERALAVLDGHLANHTFFVGERITLADLAIAAFIQRHVMFTIDEALRLKYFNIIRHLETVVNQPKLKDIYGPLVYVEKAIQFTPPAKEKVAKPAAATVAPTPKAKPKEQDNDEEEEYADQESKGKNPLDDLPKSTFNLEDWKRAYSNKETRGAGGAIEWFYQNYDPAGFSVWRVDFKYNDELTQTFMSANQIGGFFNRLEGSRKYLFGSMGVLGTSGNSRIAGALILRGLEVEPVVSVAPDWESYSFKKLDLTIDEDKAIFEAALAWDLTIDGLKWADGKNFK